MKKKRGRRESGSHGTVGVVITTQVLPVPCSNRFTSSGNPIHPSSKEEHAEILTRFVPPRPGFHAIAESFLLGNKDCVGPNQGKCLAP